MSGKSQVLGSPPKKKYPDINVDLECQCAGACTILRFNYRVYEGELMIFAEHYISKLQRDGIVRTMLDRIKAAWYILTGREYLLDDMTIFPKRMQQFAYRIQGALDKYPDEVKAYDDRP